MRECKYPSCKKDNLCQNLHIVEQITIENGVKKVCYVEKCKLKKVKS